MPEAARVGDKITHSDSETGLVLGVLAGVALGVLLVAGTAATGGALAVVVGTSACVWGSMLGSVGEFVGSFISEEKGQILTGCPRVMIQGQPAARAIADVAHCDDHGDSEPSTGVMVAQGHKVAQGSPRVIIAGYPAARVKDGGTCSYIISTGCRRVIIGGGQGTFAQMSSEVPEWMHWTVMAMGFVGGAGLIAQAPKALRLLMACKVAGGFAGGWGGSAGAGWAAGEIWGQGSWQQKVASFGGGFAGGLLGWKMGGSKPVVGGVQGAWEAGGKVYQSAAEELGNLRDTMLPQDATGMRVNPDGTMSVGGRPGQSNAGWLADRTIMPDNTPNVNEMRLTGVGGGDPDYIGPSRRAWNDPNMTSDEFIRDYRDRYPDTGMSDADIRARFNNQDRLNPVTGKFINIDQTPAIPAEYQPLLPDEQPPGWNDLSPADQADLQSRMDAREQDLPVRDAAKARMDALETAGQKDTPAYEQAKAEWTDAFNRVNESSRQLGERASDLYIQDQYAGTGNIAEKVYPTNPGSRPGDFDAVYEVRNANGDVVGYDVVEAKGGSSPLSEARYNGQLYQQGHPEYFDGTANNMADSQTNPAMSDVGQRILDAKQAGVPIRYLEVRAPIDASTNPQTLQDIQVHRFRYP